MTELASLRAHDIAHGFGAVRVLDGVNVDVTPGRRIGLYAPNGTGKTTLLRILAGELEPERGTVSRAPAGANLGHLTQEPDRRSGESVGDFLARRTGVAAATRQLDGSTAALAAGEAGADDWYGSALERWLSLGAADFDDRVAGAMAEVGLRPDLVSRPTTVLSGGEMARAAFAGLLLSRFDLYLLDEPTNDLDLRSLEPLEQWILSRQAGLVLVSHDRRFLQRTVTHVLEIDPFSRVSTLFSGGWDAFLAERAAADRHAWERFEEYDARRAGLAGRAQREREWASQGLGRAKNRPDDNDKNIRAYKINQTEQLAARAARTERAIERLDVVDKPRKAWELRLTFATAERSGVVAELCDVVVELDEFVLGPLNLSISHGERIAIVGRNGSGKTTLIDTIVGRTPPTRGTVRRSPSVRFGEITQARSQLDTGSGTLIDRFGESTGLSRMDARTLLAKFGIEADHVTRAVGSLSPGERTRAILALLMAKDSNCLVLDEPTNHLDLPAIEQLERALDAFGGTVLLVSHDRALLDAVRTTRRIELDAGRIVGDAPQ